MKSFSKTVIALSMATVLGGSAMNALATNYSNNSQPFDGAVVNEMIVIKQFPQEVQSGSIAVQNLDQQSLASIPIINAEKAIQIASLAVPGRVLQSKLGDENGFLIWEVDVQTANGQQTELKLDAGNGRLLAANSENNDAEDEGGENENNQESDDEHSNWKFWDNNEHENGEDRD